MTTKENLDQAHIKLDVELIPRPLWGINLRTLLRAKDWDYLRNLSYQKANGHCEICNIETDKLECHEIWDYDDEEYIQILAGTIALCELCHLVKHYGHAQIIGRAEEAGKHFMQINNCSSELAKLHITTHGMMHTLRSEHDDWTQDLSWLDQFNIKLESSTRKL